MDFPAPSTPSLSSQCPGFVVVPTHVPAESHAASTLLPSSFSAGAASSRAPTSVSEQAELADSGAVYDSGLVAIAARGSELASRMAIDVHVSLDTHETPALPMQMPPACFRDDPQAEVDHYFAILANSRGACAQQPDFWERIPQDSQYIADHSFAEILQHSIEHLKKIRESRILIEEAAKRPPSKNNKFALGSRM